MGVAPRDGRASHLFHTAVLRMITITIECPKHPAYNAKIRPGNGCLGCGLVFDVRNNTRRVISVPLEERTTWNERVVKCCE